MAGILAILVGWLGVHKFFLGYTTAQSPANLIQAQRDYFGAHTFRRTDQPADELFHADWSARRPL